MSNRAMEDLDLRFPTVEDCLGESAAQFDSVTMSMSHIINILFDFVNDVQFSRAEVLSSIVQLMQQVSGEKMKEMCSTLPLAERTLFAVIAAKFAECEKLIHTNMNKVAQLQHTNEHKQTEAIKTLEQKIQERDKEIRSLKTTENVVLWEKEKGRLLKEKNEKIEELKIKLLEEQALNEALRQKLEDQIDNLKMEKMKVEITRKRSTANMPADSDLALLEDLKRKMYLFEKDLQFAEKQMNQFQTDILGLLGGLQGELNVISENSRNGANRSVLATRRDSATILSTVGELKALSDTIDKIKSAVAGDVDLRVMRADLSEKYVPGRSLTVKPIRIRKQSKVSQTSNGLTALTDLPPLLTVGKSNGRDTRPILSNQQQQQQQQQQHEHHNPSLRRASHGTLDMLAVMKHFPTLKAAYVKDQWNNFNRYDADNNGELDMSEIMKAITCYMPSQVKSSHIEAAVREIDIDGSGTLDFYEYLQVAMLLEQRKGNSKLFRIPEVAQLNKQISKTCSIQ